MDLDDFIIAVFCAIDEAVPLVIEAHVCATEGRSQHWPTARC